MAKSHLAKGRCFRVKFGSSHSGRCLRKYAGSLSSQSSLEYLLIVALTFAIIVPTTYLFYNYSKESSQEIVDAQITKIGRSVIDLSDTIFYSGQGSKTVIDLNVPDNIASAEIIDNRELVFNITTISGVSEIVFFSSVNITTISSNCIENVCKLPDLATPGLKKVKIEAIGKNSVTIETI